MLLYNSTVSGNCYKVRLLLAHLGIEYERRELDVVDRSNRPEVLGGLNPDLRVPTLVLDDGRPLAESGAILWYFGEGTRFVPDDRYDAREGAAVDVLRAVHARAGDRGRPLPRRVLGRAREARDADRVEDEGRATARSTRWSGTSTEEASTSSAQTLTLADIALYAYTHVAHEGGFDLAGYPAIRTWLDRVAAEPGHVTIDA